VFLLFFGIAVGIAGIAGGKEFGQGVELRFPEGAVVLDPGGGGFHGLGVETAAVDAAIDFAAEEAGGFEDAEMLGDGGEGHVERGGEGFDGGFAVGETSEDGAAGGIGESREGGVKGVCSGGRIVNHTVYYCAARRGCQGCSWGWRVAMAERRELRSGHFAERRWLARRIGAVI
jgi:hypothetical protein